MTGDAATTINAVRQQFVMQGTGRVAVHTVLTVWVKARMYPIGQVAASWVEAGEILINMWMLQSLCWRHHFDARRWVIFPTLCHNVALHKHEAAISGVDALLEHTVVRRPQASD